MSSINNGCEFTLGGISSEDIGVMMCTGFGSTSRSKNVESRTIVTTTNLAGRTFNLHGTKYDSPLAFDIIIVNKDATYIDADKERELKKIILKEERQWFNVEQNDLSGVYYYVIARSAEILDVGSMSTGMLVNFECDAPHAWSKLYSNTYSTVSGTLTFRHSIACDFDKYEIFPTLIITPTTNGNISIKNNTLNKTVTINNCVSNEVITIDFENQMIESSNGRVLVSDWNLEDFILISGNNSVTLTGNFNMVMSYRLPIRVGA
jgi:phage-related protein